MKIFVAGATGARGRRLIKIEDDPLDPTPPPSFWRTIKAIRYLETAVTSETALEGLILRYGSFYGPGTAMGGDDWMVNDIRKRRIPIVGGRGGVWSFIHIDDAARFRFAAVERGEFGVYNIVDDDPAPYRNGYLHSHRQLTPDFHLDCPPGLPD